MLLPAQRAAAAGDAVVARPLARRRQAAGHAEGGQRRAGRRRHRPSAQVMKAKCSRRRGVCTGWKGRACTSPSTASRAGAGSGERADRRQWASIGPGRAHWQDDAGDNARARSPATPRLQLEAEPGTQPHDRRCPIAAALRVYRGAFDGCTWTGLAKRPVPAIVLASAQPEFVAPERRHRSHGADAVPTHGRPCGRASACSSPASST